VRVHQLKALVFWCTEAKKALAFPKNSFSFSGRVQLSVYPSSCLKGLMHDE